MKCLTVPAPAPWIGRILSVAAVLSIAYITDAQRLDQTAVGRFGAGHAITPNTASQDLLAWNTLCDGSSFEVRVYDRKARPVSLGSCGLKRLGLFH